LYDAFLNLSLIARPIPKSGILQTAIDLKFLFFIFLIILYKLLAASVKSSFLLKLKLFLIHPTACGAIPLEMKL